MAPPQKEDEQHGSCSALQDTTETIIPLKLPSKEAALSTACLQAQDRFLKRHYRKALTVCNEFFGAHQSTSSTGALSQSRRRIRRTLILSNPLVLLDKTYTISVSFQQEQKQTSKYSADHASSIVVVALQSWYELDKLDQKQQQQGAKTTRIRNSNKQDDWKHLQPLLEYTQQTSIPSLECFIVWIYFWEDQGLQQQQAAAVTQPYEVLAIHWTLQVLHFLQILSNQYDKDDDEPCHEELWIHCMTKQLPKLLSSQDDKNNLLLSKLVKGFLRFDDGQMDDSLSSIITTTSFHKYFHVIMANDENNDHSLSRRTLHKKKFNNIDMILKLLQKAWQDSHDAKHCQWIAKASTILEQEQRLLLEQVNTARHGDGMIRGYSRSSSSILPPTIRSNKETNGSYYYHYLGRIQSWIKEQYKVLVMNSAAMEDSSDDNNKNSVLSSRQRIGISILFVLLTLRYRMRVSKTLKTVLVSFLAPLTEVLEVLGIIGMTGEEEAATAANRITN